MYRKTIHRLVAEYFIPNPENKPTVNHKIPGAKGKKINTEYNLEWATLEEQELHKKKANMVAYGEKSGMCKLPDNIIRMICDDLMNDIPNKIISNTYGVTQAYISDLYYKRRRKNITCNYNFPQKSHYNYNKKYSTNFKYCIEQLIKKGYTNNEIYKILKLEKSNKHRNMIDRVRKKIKFNDYRK